MDDLNDLNRLKEKCTNMINVQNGFINRCAIIKHQLVEIPQASAQYAELQFEMVQLEGKAHYLNKIIDYYNNRICELEGLNKDIAHITNGLASM